MSDNEKNQKKRLTPQQQGDKLLDKIRRQALEMGYGDMRCIVKVYQGFVKEIRVERLGETWRAD